MKNKTIFALISACFVPAPLAAAVPSSIEVRSSHVAQMEVPAYFDGALRFPWSEGADYRLFAAPGQVSDIALQPGELLVSVAAGDTARWVIGDTSSGSGIARRAHVLVKPVAAGLATNLVIATDRRVYHVKLESRPHASVSNLSWTYPEDSLLALKGGEAHPVDTGSSPLADLEKLNFNYEIEGDPVSWRPLRAFDDGRHLYIEFGPTLVQGAAPPLFVCGADGKTELVNYRLRGRFYIVDRLFGHGELRLGEGRQLQRISIRKIDAQRTRCGSRAS